MFANYGTHAKDSRYAVFLFPCFPFPRTTTIFLNNGSGRPQTVPMLHRMVSQCTFFHVQKGKRFSKLAILYMFIVRHSNNMKLHSAKLKTISCCHPQKLPLVYVGIHTCSDNRKKHSSKVSFSSEKPALDSLI